MSQGLVFDGDAMLAQSTDSTLQVDGVPEDDGGGDDQVESACTVTLVLKASIAQVTLAVKEDRTGKRIPGLALVETDLDTPAQAVSGVCTVRAVFSYSRGFSSSTNGCAVVLLPFNLHTR